MCDEARCLGSRGTFSVSIAARRRTPLQIVAIRGCSNRATLATIARRHFPIPRLRGSSLALAHGRSRDRAARTQLRYVPSRRLPLPGRVARPEVAPNGGCELRPSPRFFWAKVWRLVDGNVANVRRECWRADSHRARSSRRMIASMEDVERWSRMSRDHVSSLSTLLQHRLIWRASLFRDMSNNCDFVNDRLRPKWALGLICIIQVPRSSQLKIET